MIIGAILILNILFKARGIKERGPLHERNTCV
jgi:hypothetical protein